MQIPPAVITAPKTRARSGSFKALRPVEGLRIPEINWPRQHVSDEKTAAARRRPMPMVTELPDWQRLVGWETPSAPSPPAASAPMSAPIPAPVSVEKPPESARAAPAAASFAHFTRTPTRDDMAAISVEVPPVAPPAAPVPPASWPTPPLAAAPVPAPVATPVPPPQPLSARRETGSFVYVRTDPEQTIAPTLTPVSVVAARAPALDAAAKPTFAPEAAPGAAAALSSKERYNLSRLIGAVAMEDVKTLAVGMTGEELVALIERAAAAGLIRF